MRFGSHFSRGRGGGCGSGGRGPVGPARGPCSAPGPPRAASSRAGALGPAEARAARQGPGCWLCERLPARRDGRSSGSTRGVRAHTRAEAGRPPAPSRALLAPRREHCVAAAARPFSLAPPRPAETPPPAGSGPAERLCPLPRNRRDPCSNRAPALAPTFG
ncbi:uncharacterized protein LOC103796208 [Callithrix jacchus]